MTNNICSAASSLLIAVVWATSPMKANELDRVDVRDDSNTNGRIAKWFQGIDEALIDVKFIAVDAAKANVIVRNNTDDVLHIELPNAFAAVPVLGQFGNRGQNFGGQNFGGQGFGGNEGRGGGGATQGVGGGFNAGQAQGPGLGFGQAGRGQAGFGQGGLQAGGLMRIAPGKTRKLKATTVCLEHGKPDPNPRVAYRMIPIDQFTDNEKVVQLCTQLGRGEIEQKPAQAAAWHLANGLAWDQLANINRVQSRYLGHLKMFSTADLKEARLFVAETTKPSSNSGSGDSNH